MYPERATHERAVPFRYETRERRYGTVRSALAVRER
jgi:hypothetical protein